MSQAWTNLQLNNDIQMTFLGNWQASWKNKSEFPQRIDRVAIQSWPSINTKGSKLIGIKGPSPSGWRRGSLFSTHRTAHTRLQMCVKCTCKFNLRGLFRKYPAL